MDTTITAIKTAGVASLEPMKVQRTNASGQTIFEDVPDYAKSGSYAGKPNVYMIIETDAPPFTANWSVPIVVMTPFYNDESEKIDTFNLFPKNTETKIDKSLNHGDKDSKTVTMPNPNITPENPEEMITVSVYDYEKGMDINYDIEFMVPLNIDAYKDTDPEEEEEEEEKEYLYTEFKIVDTPTENLGFKELATPAFEVETAPDTWSDAGLALNTHYTIASNGNGFTVNFNLTPETLTKLAEHKGMQMRLNYTMTLLTDSTPLQFEDNEATVTFNHNGNAYHDTDEGERVIPGGRHFHKYDGSKTGTGTSVAGAEFVVGKTREVADEDGEEGATKSETTYAIFKDEAGTPLAADRADTSTVEGAASIEWTTDKDAATRIVSATDGKFSVDALEYGSYFVEETKAAPGFVLPNDPITDFVVNETSFADTVNNPDEVKLTDPEEIANYPKGTLPSTGGTGIFAFLAVGTALMMGAYLWFKNSKKQEV